MRDMVEIGMGREARRTWQLDDVSIVPSRRTRSSKDVDTTWNIDAYSFGINRYNYFHYFSGKDGVHHNANGRALMAEKIAQALR